jgi:hypothetical protein
MLQENSESSIVQLPWRLNPQMTRKLCHHSVGCVYLLWLLSPAAGNVTCKVQLRNAGSVRLTDLYVAGDANDCVFAGPVLPAESVNCSMTR